MSLLLHMLYLLILCFVFLCCQLLCHLNDVLSGAMRNSMRYSFLIGAANEG